MAFAPGDVVVLKSGGQPLTVVAIEEDGVECLWLGDNGELYRESIPNVALAGLDDAEDTETEEEEAEEDAA